MLTPSLNVYFILAFLSIHFFIEANAYDQTYKIEKIPDSFAEMGEGPHWDVATQNLYYVDINAGKILRYDYNKNRVYKAKVEGEQFASFIIPVEGTTDQFAVGSGHRVIIVRWDGYSATASVVKTLFEVEMDDERFVGNRFNDGKCDSRGRLFAGTMRYVGDVYEFRYGHLYKFEKGGKVEVVKSDVGISNGLGWNDKTKKFYFLDTADYEVKEYDYDVVTGNATNSKVVYNLRKTSPKDHLQPDGMTIDTEGNIYVGIFNGYSIYKINPSTGKVLLEIKFPCKQITSAAFGGPYLDILYVTTACLAGETDLSATVFKVTGLGARGLPMVKIQI